MASSTATRVPADLDGYEGEARLYRLDPPLEGHEYVVVSAVVVSRTGPETYIFPADSSGDVVAWGELPGSFRGGLDHQEALEGAGYTVVEETVGDDDDLCEYGSCQNQATHTESWYDEEGVDARVCDDHE